MNKYLFIVALLFAACGNSGNTSTEREEKSTSQENHEPEAIEDSKIPDKVEIGDVEFKVTEITGKEFRNYSRPLKWVEEDNEAENIAHDGGDAVKRIGDSLVFTTSENEQVILVNNHKEDDEEWTNYTYKKYLPTAYQFVVSGSYYEYWNCLLIDHRNGEKHDLPGYPYVSPDGKYLIATNSDIEAEFTDNAIALFEIKEDRIEPIDQEIMQTWGPGEVRWIDDKTLAMEIDVWKNKKLAKKYIKLTMQN